MGVDKKYKTSFLSLELTFSPSRHSKSNGQERLDGNDKW